MLRIIPNSQSLNSRDESRRHVPVSVAYIGLTVWTTSTFSDTSLCLKIAILFRALRGHSVQI